MAIFKILKGPSARIDTGTTPFTEGYAYFTPDDGGFYIDAIVGTENKRIRINPPGGSKAIEATLLGSGWEDGSQTLEIAEVKAASNGILGITQDINATQLEAVINAELYLSGQKDGSITVSAFGDTPSVDIPVQLILLLG